MIQDLHHVRAFLVAARVGNFTRAAQELRLSQSAFTVQIRQLEEALGVRLFDRGKHGAALTPAGREVHPHLERIILDAEAVVARTRQLTDMQRGVVSIAALPSAAVYLLPRHIAQFRQSHPGIEVQIHDVVAGKLIEAVKNETADFGIGVPLLRADRDLTLTPLLTDRLCVFLPLNHHLVHQKNLTLSDVARQPLIVTGRESSVRELLDQAFRQNKLLPQIAYEVNYMATAVSMTKAGLGIAVLPEVVATMGDSSGLRAVPIVRPVLTREIFILQRKGRSLSPAAVEMIRIISAATKPWG
ncbi:MAG TPA: LysR family transcriptional regulator [Terracidiphilus sp.]